MLLDDGPGKAVGIDHYIGRVPIAAFGNSDGDIAMLQTTTNSPQSKPRPRLAAFVWHTDAAREYAYDRDTHGRPPRPGAHARAAAWLVPHRHEEGLEGRLPVRAEAIAPVKGLTLNVQSTSG